VTTWGSEIGLTRRKRLTPLLTAILAGFTLSVPAEAAQRVEDTFFNSVIPSRVDHLIGFTPTTPAVHPPGQRVVPIEVRVGGRSYRWA
jgi:hypothetical protein